MAGLGTERVSLLLQLVRRLLVWRMRRDPPTAHCSSLALLPLPAHPSALPLACSRVASQYDGFFRADKAHNLIVRLRHNVIRAGLRRINLAYSRIR